MSRKFSTTRRPEVATPMPPQSTMRRPGSSNSGMANSGRAASGAVQTHR